MIKSIETPRLPSASRSLTYSARRLFTSGPITTRSKSLSGRCSLGRVSRKSSWAAESMAAA